MTDSSGELDSIRGRLALLERRSRFLKVLVALLILLLGGAGILALTADPPGTVHAQRLVLTDARGRVRCRLEVDGDGGVLQSFIDIQGRERVRIAVDGEGSARMRLYDEHGVVRVGAAALGDSHEQAPGAAVLSVLGHGNPGADLSRGGIMLRTFADGTVEQRMYDSRGVTRTLLAAQPEDGLARFSIFGKDDASLCSLQLGTTDAGSAFAAIYGPDGRERMNQSVDAAGVASHALRDPAGFIRVQTRVVPASVSASGENAGGFATQLFYDAAGRLRVDTSTYDSGQASTDYRDPAGTRRMSLVSFANAESIMRHFDGTGRVRQYIGTYPNGEAGHALIGRDGRTRFSAMVRNDDSLAWHQDRNAASRAWEATGNVLQVIDLAERLGILGGRDR